MASKQGKWALVTGASPGGIGEAEVVVLLKRGINVIATAIDAPENETLDKQTNGRSLLTLRMDVTSPSSIDAVVKRVQEIANGELHYLFNNAGFGYYMPLMDIDISRMKAEYEVNVFGLLAVTQAFFPLLRAAKGTVINQASIAGLQGWNFPFNGAYSSSKAAAMTLSNTMRAELLPFEINVVTLVTGAVKTGFFQNRVGGSLPESSPYQPIREKVEASISGSAVGMKGHDRYRVVEESMSEILRQQPPRFLYRGYLAGVLSWMYWLAPTSLMDYLALKFGSLDQLRVLLTTQNTEKKEI